MGVNWDLLGLDHGGRVTILFLHVFVFFYYKVFCFFFKEPPSLHFSALVFSKQKQNSDHLSRKDSTLLKLN